MNPESGPADVTRMFKAGDFWSSNMFAAYVGGAGAGILLLVIIGIVLWNNPTQENVLFGIVLFTGFVASGLGLIPGNWIAGFPYAVEVKGGKGLQVYAPLKKLFIPIEEVRDVRESFLHQGFVVRLNRRRGLLKGFVIHRLFGAQAEPLALAIREEIQRRERS